MRGAMNFTIKIKTLWWIFILLSPPLQMLSWISLVIQRTLAYYDRCMFAPYLIIFNLATYAAFNWKFTEQNLTGHTQDISKPLHFSVFETAYYNAYSDSVLSWSNALTYKILYHAKKNYLLLWILECVGLGTAKSKSLSTWSVLLIKFYLRIITCQRWY